MSDDVNPKSYHIGSSDYSSHKFQPWDIWEEYNLDPWDADIIKRVLRTKKYADKTPDEARLEDYLKIKHICSYKINKLNQKILNDAKNNKLESV